MPSRTPEFTRAPPVRRIGHGVFEVKDDNRPKLNSKERNLVNRIIAANDEFAALKLLLYLQKRCKCKFSRCG